MTDNETRFPIGSIVRYVVGSGGQHWHGRVCAREVYSDELGDEVCYHVRWIAPSGQPDASLSRVRESELEAST